MVVAAFPGGWRVAPARLSHCEFHLAAGWLAGGIACRRHELAVVAGRGIPAATSQADCDELRETSSETGVKSRLRFLLRLVWAFFIYIKPIRYTKILVGKCLLFEKSPAFQVRHMIHHSMVEIT